MIVVFIFFLMIRRPPRSTLFPYTRSSDLGDPPEAGGRARRAGLLRDAPRAAHRPRRAPAALVPVADQAGDRKSTRLNSSHANISYAVFCLKKKTNTQHQIP